MNWRRRIGLVMAVCLLWLYAMPAFSVVGYDGSARFSDVSPNSRFNEAIGWAVDKNITDGTSPDTFTPDGKCTVQAILKFIWAYYGRPSYADHSDVFVDVSNAFRDASIWAYVSGIVKGNQGSDGLYLLGGEYCTRLWAVRYLWMLAGRPTGFQESADQFTDIGHDPDFPDRDAIGWAVAKGITNGTSPTTFSPETICTRGQIVTFLYRYENNVGQRQG